jgi:predicted CoA-substrate-specific enzyme activase
MKVAGIDIGSLTTKAVIMDDSKVISYVVNQTGDEVEQAARQALEEALSKAGICTQGELYIISTGIGSRGLQFGQGQKAVATCLARGAFYFFPSVRVVIDLGAETSTVVKVNERGRLIDWANQDKCASGTGLFLQQVAKLMQMPISEMGKLPIPEKAAEITSTCAVFAESEIISHIHRVPPTPKEEIVAGVYQSVVGRLMSLIKRVGIAKDVVVTGGVALGEGLVRVLERELGFSVLVPDEPQIVGAVGAALIAGETAKRGVSQ